MRKRVSLHWSRIGPPLITVILLLVVWQTVVTWWEIPKWLLPSPIDILNEGIANFSRLFTHSAATIKVALIGLAVGSSFGVLLAILLHIIPVLKRGIYPLLILSQNIPTIALAPLLIIWFGYGLLPKVIVITLVCFFPIVVSMLDGFRQTDRNMLNYMQMIGASRKDIFIKLEIPSVLPFLFAGLKISATYSVMGAVIGEWLGAREGLGVYMTLAISSFRTDRVFVAISVIVMISLVFFGLILLLERVLAPWHKKEG